MEGKGLTHDQRGISEVYGTVLVVSFALGLALFLVGSGWVIVDQLSTDTTDSLTEDSMRNVRQSIDSVADASVNETVTLEFPEGQGGELSANNERGAFNLTIRTQSDEFWERTVAEKRGKSRTGSNVTLLGVIRHESDRYGETVFQGGALWQKAGPDADSILLSEPSLDFTGDTLEVGIVSVADVDAITRGSEVRIQKSAESDATEELRQFMAQYWTDRYNPRLTVPVEVNVTIESRYADGWARFAETQLSADPNDVIYPFRGDEERVRIVFGQIGEEPAATRDPAFGDDDILYSGSSDLAYLYHNQSAHGDVEMATDGPKAPDLEGVTGNEYGLALYNSSGQWIVYNSTSPTRRWETAAGEPVDPDNTDALNASRDPTGPPPGSPAAVDAGDDKFYIDPPVWLEESPAAPICVVTNSGSSPDVTEYIDEAGEDCLSRMVGLDASLVEPVQEVPEFNVTMRTDDSELADTYDVGDGVGVGINVTNEGAAAGNTPAAAYVINETNWDNGEFSRAKFVNGTRASNLELDPDEYDRINYTFEAKHWMIDDEWVVFGAVDGTVVPVTDDVTGDTATFRVESPDTNFSVVDVETMSDSVETGNTQRVEVVVNESAEEISNPATQHLQLRADGRLVNQTEITHSSGENATHTIAWEPRTGDTGPTTLNASTYDHSGTTSTLVTGPTVDGSEFEVEVLGTNSSIVESQNLTVDANVTNTGDVADTQPVVLNNFDGRPVDERTLTLDPGESREITLTWETVVGDAGNGSVRVVSDDDSGSESAVIEELENEIRDPVDVVFVLDETGSMEWNDPDGDRIEATKRAIDAMNASMDRAAAVGYDYVCRGWWCDYYDTGYEDGYKWHHRLSGNLSAVKAALETDPEGSTNIALGIDQAESELNSDRSDPSHRKVMIVLTDGKDNSGADPITRAKAVDDDITIYTVGLGGAEEDVLREIATDGGSGEGAFYWADESDQLTDIFKLIIDEATEPETPTFEVGSINANDPVVVGERVVLEAGIKNTGAGGDRIVSLVDANGTYVDSERLSLGSGESGTVTLDWDTDGVDPGTKDLTVRTVSDEASTEVEIQGPSAGPQLKITGLSHDGPVTVGEQLTVDVGIENVGGDDADRRLVSLAVVDNATGNTIARDGYRINLDRGETGTATLEWNTGGGDVGEYTLEVRTNYDSEDGSTRVRTETSDLDPEILTTNAPVRAGGQLEVVVEVNNTGSDAETGNLLLTDARSNVTVDMVPGLTVAGSGTDTATLTWNTRVGDGDDDPVPIEAEIANAPRSDGTEVEIALISDLDAASLDRTASPIDISLDEVDVKT